MVFLTLVDISLQTGWWIGKHIFYVGRYVIYGRQKTEEEKVNEKLEQILDNEQKLRNDLCKVKLELELERGGQRGERERERERNGEEQDAGAQEDQTNHKRRHSF